MLPGSAGLHVPWRAYGTHAYLVSPRGARNELRRRSFLRQLPSTPLHSLGARKLLEKLPRACFHVDNVAWGLRPLRLLCVHPLLAKQTHSDTTVGGLSGEEWIPAWFKQVDDYTGVSFSWAWNCPMVRLGRGGPLVTVGRAFGCSCIALTAAVLHASITRSLALLQAWAASVFAFGALIRLLSSQHK